MKRKEKGYKVYLFGHPIEQIYDVVEFVINIGAVCLVLYNGIQNVFGKLSAVYLMLAFFVYHSSNNEEKQKKDYEIAELRREIQNLESRSKEKDYIIDLLNTELEKTRDNSHQ